MTDMHDVITVGIPLIAILAGILFSRSDIKELRAEMVARFDKFESGVDGRFKGVTERFNRIDDRLDRIDADLRQFYHLSGKLEGRIDTLEKRG